MAVPRGPELGPNERFEIPKSIRDNPANKWWKALVEVGRDLERTESAQ